MSIITPTDQILCTFNVFKNGDLKDLDSFGTFLNENSSQSFNNNRNTLVGTNTTEPSAGFSFEENKSESASYQKIAGSLGIKGKYGFYSGSLQVQASNSQNTTATSYSGSYCGVIHMGVVKLNNTKDVKLSYFNSKFQKGIKQINSLQSAKNFIDTFGTHVVLGLNLGGAFSLCVTSNTSTYKEKTDVSTAVSAAYNTTDESISGVAKATLNLINTESKYNLQKHSKFFGGNPTDGSLSSTNVANWIKSCKTTKTAYSISDSIDMATLAKNNRLSNQANILKEYVNLVILQRSLENPTILSNHTPLVAGSTVQVTSNNEPQYKIVGGGAAISSKSNASSFLTGSYPEQLPSGEITGWTATSHDCMASANTSNYLTSYAVAVYDPGNFLDVFVSRAPGSNLSAGTDSAGSPNFNVGAYILTGGGLKTDVISGSYVKYMISNGPKNVNGGWVSWDASVCDYGGDGATTVDLTGYAIGIACAQLQIYSSVVPAAMVQAEEQGNQNASTSTNIIGGGVILGAVTAGAGNLVRQTYPSDTKTWTEYNTDLDGSNSPCKATGYAISITTNIGGVN